MKVNSSCEGKYPLGTSFGAVDNLASVSISSLSTMNSNNDVDALQDAVTLAQEIRVDAELAPMTWAESTLEAAISITCLDLSMAASDQEQRVLFARVQDLHSQRTANQVARMELVSGLRK